MSLSPLALSIERRERHPYRSLYAEMLFQSFRDALAEVHEGASTTAQELGGSEEGRTRRDSKQKQHALDAHLPKDGCLQ